MPKVWNMDNKIKFDPADVKTWKIYDPGEWDYYTKKRLTRWQVAAIYDKAATVYVGYYDSEQKAIDAVDALDAMKRDELLDSDAELLGDPVRNIELTGRSKETTC